MWEVRDPSGESDRGLPRTDRNPLAAALVGALDAYDVILLLPKSAWSYPDRENATAHVVLGEINVAPDAGCRTAFPQARRRRQVRSLSPEESAAVLRERCLGFLFGFPSPPVRLDGLIWQSNGELPVDAIYLADIDRDMNRARAAPRPPGLDSPNGGATSVTGGWCASSPRVALRYPMSRTHLPVPAWEP